MDPPATWFSSYEWLLFSRLMTLNLDSAIAWQVVALWVWISENGNPNFMVKLLTSSNAVIHYLSAETLVCLNCVKTGRITAHPLNNTPFMQLMTNNAISLQFLHNNRSSALEGMVKIMGNVSARRYVDIALHFVANAIAPAMSEIREIVMVSRSSCNAPAGEGSTCRAGDVRERNMNQDISSIPEASLPANNTSNNTSQRLTVEGEDERSVLVTFSKRSPVSEMEARDFLTRVYGDCVESIYMLNPIPRDEKALYAMVVFKQASTIETILDGKVEVDFAITAGKLAKARRWKAK